MARSHLLCAAASALFTLAVQAAPFAPVAPVAPALPPSSQAAAVAPVVPVAPVAPLAVTPAAPATATPAAPAAPARRTLWLCSLSERLTQLVCVADTDPAEQADADDDAHAAGGNGTAAPPPVTAQVRGTRFPLDPQRLWVVDLWTPPSAADDLALLARATICYRSPGCEVRLSLPDLGGSAGQRVAQGARWRSR